ncbi:MAG: hypothetical protein KatS3mg031_0613 [Chitinophagales bacterium]|nr:MAG: hypothetical protein KatS3mg031_0613 [Chitinophagales bacterium]
MKRFTSLMIAVAALVAEVNAQQIPLYSQYYYNPFIYNPARTGEKEATQLFVIYRKQWADFKGAPETRAATIDGLIKDKIGLGGYVYSDITNIIERLGVQLDYAYHLRFGEHVLALGIAVGVQEVSVDFNRARVHDPNESVLTSDRQRGLNFDGSAGVSYRFKGLHAGFSVPQVLGTSIKFQNNDDRSYQMGRHYLATLSYDIPVIQEVFYIAPNAMFRATDRFNTFQVDAGASFRYKELAWVAAQYRYDYAVSFAGGFRIHDRVQVGYAYDWVLNELKNYAGGTHELLLGIKFGKREDKGLIETLKNLQNRQADQEQQLAELRQQNDDLQQAINEKDEQISQLKNEIELMVREFQDSLRNAKEELLQLQQDFLKSIPASDIDMRPGSQLKTDPPPPAKYMIVVGAFSNENNAARKAADLRQKGIDAGIFYRKSKDIYYIFLKNTGTLKEGLEKLNQLKTDPQYKDAWIYYIED